MLRTGVLNMKMRKSFATLALLGATASSFAQTAPDAPVAPVVLDVNSPEFKQQVEATRDALPAMHITPDTVGSGLTPEERQKAEALAASLSDTALQRYTTEGKAFEQSAMQFKRRADDIADSAMAERRNRVLKFLGINPEGDSALYYFLSFSMPMELMRAYVVEAMWSGGTIIFRGAPPDRKIEDFMIQDLRQLLYGKGSSVNIDIDPRLYDAYDIKTIPTIVYTRDRRQLTCDTPSGFNIAAQDGSNATYSTCSAIDQDKYWKMSGAVTSDYALRAFVEAGAPGAQVFYDALRKGAAPGLIIPQKQQEFKGEWKDIIPVEQIMAEKAAIEEARRKVDASSAAASAAGDTPAPSTPAPQ